MLTNNNKLKVKVFFQERETTDLSGQNVFPLGPQNSKNESRQFPWEKKLGEKKSKGALNSGGHY